MYSTIKKNLLRWILPPVLAFAVVGGGVALADTTTSAQMIVAPTPQPVQCIILTRPMSVGSRDTATAGEVTTLQNFLNTQGYLGVSATGYFGPLTISAVQKFQASQGISTTGTVGPLTRAAIARFHCKFPVQTPVTIYSVTPTSGPVGTTVSITGFGFTNDNTIHFGSGAIVHVPISSSIAIACTNSPTCHGGINQTLTFTVPAALNPVCYYSGCKILSLQTTPGNYAVTVENTNGTSNAQTFTVTSSMGNSLSLNSVSPSSGPIGTPVVLYGSGFTANDYVLIGGGVLKPSSVSSDGTQIMFTMPSGIGPYCPGDAPCPMYLRLLTPGAYQISVKDEASGTTSNSVGFTITDSSTSNQPITINGVDTPSSLPIGTPGTWTVHVSVPAASTGNLHYSVVWGDEVTPVTNTAAIMAPSGNVQSSATFTHTYQHSGTYSPVFTVSNDAGQSTNVSTSIVVTPLY